MKVGINWIVCVSEYDPILRGLNKVFKFGF